MNEFQLWLAAVRPRTLVLAVAGTGLGLLLAAADGQFDWRVALLTVITAVLLQVLSNLANDYGDSLHGADGDSRIGPLRAVQSGRVSLQQMLRAVLFSLLLTGAAGLALVLLALGSSGLWLAGGFLLLGALAAWAAWAYTAAPRPYGYYGLGDLMVFVFFGLTAVLGSHFLQTRQLDAWLLLPASAAGLLAVAVLNINNLRDLQSDRAAGKRTVPVRLGLVAGRQYHALLVLLPLLLGSVAVALRWSGPVQLLFLLSAPLLLRHLQLVWRREGAALDPLLKQAALAALLFSLLFGLGQLLSA